MEWNSPPKHGPCLASTSPLRIKDVVVSGYGSASTGGSVTQPPTETAIPEADVTGLLTDLSLRPVKGSSYGTSRTAMVDSGGTLNTVEGSLSDCVHVDGTSGVCYDATQAPTFINGGTPSGTIDGSNPTFTLANQLLPQPAFCCIGTVCCRCKESITTFNRTA